MKLLVSSESWALTYNNGKGANDGEYCEMSDDYVELLKASLEKDYNEEVVVVYVDEPTEDSEFTIIRN
jgi:hypothetical protein